MSLLRLMPMWLIRRRYIALGAYVGAAISYHYLGKPIGYDRRKARFDAYEGEWVRRGNYAWTLDEFVDLGGYGRPLPPIGGER